jgi:hypothetical protein
MGTPAPGANTADPSGDRIATVGAAVGVIQVVITDRKSVV